MTLDGVDLRDISQAELRRRVATVLQDVFLFSGTVYATTSRLGRRRHGAGHGRAARHPGRPGRRLRPARLPEGYDTRIRERGANLSAGQRQLLSFARALAHGADVLVLDEATSSIDNETEALIQAGIHVLMEGKTAIAIAHRLSTIRDVDRIYVLDAGESNRGERQPRRADWPWAAVYERLHRLQSSRGRKHQQWQQVRRHPRLAGCGTPGPGC